MGFQIAIDGPAGAGKSTIARRVAASLPGVIYVDTGAIYRAMAYYLLKNNIHKGDEAKIPGALSGASISIEYRDGEQVVLLNGENVNPYLRSGAVSEMSSVCSALPQVRQKLLALQQKLGEENHVVMDGRDIGTTVLPKADLKVFLTADASVRAMRRYKEEQEKGGKRTLDEIQREIVERDERDINRPVSPLRQADDAVRLDTSYLTIDQVTEKILSLAREKGTFPFA